MPHTLFNWLLPCCLPLGYLPAFSLGAVQCPLGFIPAMPADLYTPGFKPHWLEEVKIFSPSQFSKPMALGKQSPSAFLCVLLPPPPPTLALLLTITLSPPQHPQCISPLNHTSEFPTCSFLYSTSCMRILVPLHPCQIDNGESF